MLIEVYTQQQQRYLLLLLLLLFIIIIIIIIISFIFIMTRIFTVLQKYIHIELKKSLTIATARTRR